MQQADILARIDELRQEKGWSESELLRRAQLSDAYLRNARNRIKLSSIDTIECMCGAFGISICEFFRPLCKVDTGISVFLSDEERTLIEAVRVMPEKNIGQLMGYVDGLKDALKSVDQQ